MKQIKHSQRLNFCADEVEVWCERNWYGKLSRLKVRSESIKSNENAARMGIFLWERLTWNWSDWWQEIYLCQLQFVSRFHSFGWSFDYFLISISLRIVNIWVRWVGQMTFNLRESRNNSNFQFQTVMVMVWSWQITWFPFVALIGKINA